MWALLGINTNIWWALNEYCHISSYRGQRFGWNKIINKGIKDLPVTPSVWPLSVATTVAGDGSTWQMDRVPSIELQATRDLSSLANLTAVTGNQTKCTL